MSTPGATNLVIRVAVADAASVPIAKINESLVATGSAAAAGSARTIAALGQTDAALTGTAARAAALGEANTAAATAAAGAWTRASTAIATSSTAAASSAVAVGSKFAAATELMKPLLGLVAAFGAIKFLGGAVDAGKDDVLGIRLVKQEFGDASKEVLEFGEHAAQAFGMSAAATDKLTAQFGQYLTALGMGNSKEFPEMSMQLTQVTADIAKFNGVSIETASTAVESGIAGRTRALKALGIGIDSATIAQAALNHHLGDSSGQLSVAETNMAKYYAVIDGASKQIGSMDKANGSLSKSQAQVHASLEDLQGQVGQGLVPVLAASSAVINNAVIPAFSAMFHIVAPAFSLYSVLPGPIQATTAALLVMVALRGPLIAMLTGVSDRLYLMAASGIAAKIGMAGVLETSSKLAGALAGPWGLVIAGAAILITAFAGRSKDAAVATGDFTSAIDQNTGALKGNAVAIVAKALADDGSLTKIKAAGMSLGDATLAVTGNTDAMGRSRAQLAHYIEDGLKASGMYDVNKEAADKFGETLDNYVLRLAGTGNAMDQLTGTLGLNKDQANVAKSAYDALTQESGKLSDQQTATKDAIKATNDAQADALKGLPPLNQQIDLLSGAWSTMTADVESAIAALDKLAGRTPDVAQATKAMYDALRAQRSDAKLDNGGAERLDPDRILNKAGEIDTKSDAGSRLYGTTQTARSAILASGMANYRQELLDTKDAAKSKADLGAFLTKMLPQKASTLTSIFGGDKGAAERAMKALGMTPADMQKVIIDQVAKTIADEQKKKDDAGETSGAPGEPAASSSVNQGMLTDALNGPAAVAAAAPNTPYLPGANNGNSTMLPTGGGPFAPANTDANKYKNNLSTIPSVVTTTIIANTNQADTALAGLGARLSAVTGAPNPATSAPGTPGSPSASGTVPFMAPYGSGGTAGGGSGPFGEGTAAVLAASGSSLPPGHDGNNVKAVGLHAGEKWPPVVEKWRGTALQALALSGEPASEVDEVLYRINLESTGNPHAINNPKGTGGANGIVQLMFPTWNQYKVPGYDVDIYDGLSNLLAGINYSKHQYGSMVAGFDRPGWYDEGGWLMPGGLARSQMSTPEPILTTAQWKVAETAVRHVESVSQSGGGSPVVNIHAGAIVVHGDPDDVQLERLEGKVRDIFERQLRRR